MATLYLHIGTPKTGTTSIQMFLLANREALEEKGFCFPVMPEEIVRFKKHRNGHFLVAQAQRADGSFESPEGEVAWWRGIDYVAGLFKRFPNVILTDELIWNRTGLGKAVIWKNLKKAAQEHGFEVKIVAYLRRQDEYISSLWAQLVKHTSGRWGRMHWEEALARADEWLVADYHRQLEEIAATFGREAIIARIYDRDRFPGGDIVGDFLNVLGLDMEDGFVLPEREKNPSIGSNELEIKRIINTLPEITEEAQYKVSSIAMACFTQDLDRAPSSIYSSEERDSILAKYAESNRLLARDYFGDENLPLFAPPGELPPKWRPDNPYMHEDIVRFFSEAFLAQQREIEELRDKFYFKRKLKRFARALRSRVKAFVRRK